jgi:hypothetical protein
MIKIETAPLLERLQVLPAEIRAAREACLEAAQDKARIEQELAQASDADAIDPFLLPTAIARMETAKLDLEERKAELTAGQAIAFILAAEAGLEFAP